MTLPLVQALGAMEPFGEGNPQPLLLATNVKVVGEPQAVGQGQQTLRIKVQGAAGGPVTTAVGFRMADRLPELMSEGGSCCLVFTPTENHWAGKVSVDLHIKDLCAGPSVPLEMAG